MMIRTAPFYEKVLHTLGLIALRACSASPIYYFKEQKTRVLKEKIIKLESDNKQLLL